MSDLRLDIGWIAKAVNGRLVGGDPDRLVGRVVIDSRRVEAGDLFVAIPGPRFDGHDFVPDVLGRGAAAVIVRAGALPPHPGGAGEDASAIEVADTVKALQDLARAIRRASGANVVAITGSAGKTTTKEAMAALLASRFRVVKNVGNLNNHIGLPLSLVGLRSRPDVAVMELGMNHRGEISTLVSIAEPDVRVWTNVGDAHLGFFASPDAIADAKAEILERAGSDSLLVCNVDDPRVMSRVGGFPGRTVTFGEDEKASVRACDVEDLGLDGMRARMVTSRGERTIETRLLGRGNLWNLLAASAVALELGVPLDDVVATAASLRASDRRGVVKDLRDGIRLVDDSYNSSPSALRQALEVVAHDTRARRKLAVLGEMLELGDHAIELHRESGRRAAAAGLSRLFAIGGAPAQALAEAAVSAGLPSFAVRWFDASEQAAPAVVSSIEAGDLVLVKGSRGTRTDVVVDAVVEALG